jgi:hypothetical protein
MSTLRTVVSKLRPLLEEYAAQLREVEDGIKRQGTISKEICLKCSRKDIANVIKFAENSGKSLASFLAWIKENEVRDLTSDGEVLAFKSSRKEVEGVEGSIPLLQIGGALKATTERVLYDYRMSASKLEKHPFMPFLGHAFSSIETCPHISDTTGDNYLTLVTKTAERGGLHSHSVEKLWEAPEAVTRCKLLCRECYGRIDSVGCEESIRRQGFVFVHGCPTRKIVFENLLEEHGIEYQTGEERQYFESSQFLFFLPHLNVLAYDSHRDPAATIETLKPDVLLVFAGKEELPRFLRFGANVILFDLTAKKDSLAVFDRDTPIESSEERIIEKMVSELDAYSSEMRGTEHDKVVGAFRKIGEELGFITQAEMSQKGARVDAVWLNRDGGVEVAIEVQTSPQWKKDIVTTWEAGPKLAVVLTHYKTDKAAEDIIQYSLLKYMPHRLLFISYQQKKAYLIEKGNIIKSYDVKSANE